MSVALARPRLGLVLDPPVHEGSERRRGGRPHHGLELSVGDEAGARAAGVVDIAEGERAERPEIDGLDPVEDGDAGRFEPRRHRSARLVAEIAAVVVGDRHGDDVEPLEPVERHVLRHRQLHRADAGRHLGHHDAFEVEDQRATAEHRLDLGDEAVADLRPRQHRREIAAEECVAGEAKCFAVAYPAKSTRRASSGEG